MSQRELFTVDEVGERKLLPNSAEARSRSRATPAPVGSGPAGETCKGCTHYTRVQYHDSVYLKCGLMRDEWTHGPGTDIKASFPACRKYKPKGDE